MSALSRRHLRALGFLARGLVSEDDARAKGVRWRDLDALVRDGLARRTEAGRWGITAAGLEATEGARRVIPITQPPPLACQ